MASRLQAIALAFPRTVQAPRLVLSIGADHALLGVVNDDDHCSVDKELRVTSLALRSLWAGFKLAHGLLDEYVKSFPERDEGVLLDYQAALRGDLPTKGDIPFLSEPDMSFCKQAVADVISEVDPLELCQELVLADWAVSALKNVVGSTCERSTRSLNVKRTRQGAFHEAYHGFFAMRQDLASLRAVLDRLYEQLARKTDDVGFQRLERLRELGNATTKRLGDAQVFLKLLLALDELEWDTMPDAYWQLVKLSKLVRVQWDEGAALTLDELAQVDHRGARLPDNLAGLVQHGAQLKVVRSLRPGYRLPDDGDWLQKPVVEVKVLIAGPPEPPETDIQRLVPETRVRLGKAATEYAALLDACLDKPGVPELFLDMLEALRDAGHTELLGRWLRLLGIDEVNPAGDIDPSRIGVDIELDDQIQARGRQLQVQQVLRVGYRVGDGGRVLRKAKVRASIAQGSIELKRPEPTTPLVTEPPRLPVLIASGLSLVFVLASFLTSGIDHPPLRLSVAVLIGVASLSLVLSRHGKSRLWLLVLLAGYALVLVADWVVALALAPLYLTLVVAYLWPGLLRHAAAKLAVPVIACLAPGLLAGQAVDFYRSLFLWKPVSIERSTVSMRKEPSRFSDTMAVLRRSQTVHVIDSAQVDSAEWLHVYFRSRGRGWMHSEALTSPSQVFVPRDNDTVWSTARDTWVTILQRGQLAESLAADDTSTTINLGEGLRGILRK